MDNENLIKNAPLEMMSKVKALASKLWADNNPVAVQLSVIVEEFESEADALENFFHNYDAHHAAQVQNLKKSLADNTAKLREEIKALTEQNDAYEAAARADKAKIKELKLAVDKAEATARDRYSKEEVTLIEQQILDLKKEIVEFRQLKDIDDRRIMDLEATVATKADEVERRYINKVTMLEKEAGELRTQNAAYEKAKAEDDARIKELRTQVEKLKVESRDKYTRDEVTMLEQQILDLKNEVVEFRRLKDMDDRHIAELDARLAAKTDDIEQKFIGRIAMLENKLEELKAHSAELEKINAEYEKKITELKKEVSLRDREIAARYPEGDMRQLEEMIKALRIENGGYKRMKLEDEKRISELAREAGLRKEDIERRYVGVIGTLENQLAELRKEHAALEAANSEHSGKLAEMKKLVIARDREIMDLKTRMSDAELAYSTRLAEMKEQHYSEQRRQGELFGRREDEFMTRMAERKRELDEEYAARLEQVKQRGEALELEFGEKLRQLETRKAALEADFAANRRELISTFDKVRADLEAREKALSERENPEKPRGRGWPGLG